VLGRIPGPGLRQARPNGKFGITCQTVDPKNFEDLYTFDNQFMQMALQTDYLHAGSSARRLHPRRERHLRFNRQWSTAWTDSLLLSAASSRSRARGAPGSVTFRGHDMLQLKVQAQLK